MIIAQDSMPQRSGERVSFVVGGAQKGGTTALDAYLRQHPQLCLPSTGKELHFFDMPDFDPGAAGVAAYHAQFPPAGPRQLRGEVTPSYMYWNSAPGRIHAYNPDMKWIVVLRDPAERAYSQWRMQRSRSIEALDFEAALAAEAARIAAALPHQERRFSYADRGFYAGQLRRIFALFGRLNCLIILNEDLRADAAGTLAQIQDFLGVERRAPADVGFASFADTAPALDPRVRERLLERFAADIGQVEGLIGRSLAHWRQPDGQAPPKAS